MSDTSSFSIQNARQIASNLLLLVNNRCLLSARLDASNESYITTLLSINEKNNALILDYGPKEHLNQQILRSSKISFDADFLGIKVSFTGTALKKTTYKGDPAFTMPIPKVLFWMQRREYFRMKSPLAKNSYCELILESKKSVNLKLYDISLSGFAMLNVSKEVSEQLVPASVITDCKLVLSDAGEGVISFEICAKYIINPDKLQKIQKIGCKFVDLTRPSEEVIQRYMQQLQRESLQKE